MRPMPKLVCPFALQVRAFLSLALALISGCSGRPATYPVSGTVTYSDGTPLTGGTVEFLTDGPDGKPVNASGAIDAQGNFELRTFGVKDGAVEGKHRAIVTGPNPIPSGNIKDIKPARRVAERFRNYDTSGLEFVVEPKENRYSIVVESAD